MTLIEYKLTKLNRVFDELNHMINSEFQLNAIDKQYIEKKLDELKIDITRRFRSHS